MISLLLVNEFLRKFKVWHKTFKTQSLKYVDLPFVQVVQTRQIRDNRSLLKKLLVQSALPNDAVEWKESVVQEMCSNRDNYNLVKQRSKLRLQLELVLKGLPLIFLEHELELLGFLV